MSASSHVVKLFKKLERLSTFVQLQTEFLASVQEDTEEFLQIFQRQDSDLARVNFIHEKLQEKNLLAGKFAEDGKDDRKATKFTEKANKLFALGKFPEALQHYTRSLTKAESPEALAVAYSYRSAALFKLNLIGEAIQDIDRALNNNYPDHLKPGLMSRRDKLVNIENPPKFAFYEPPPDIPDDQKNPTIPSTSDCIELKLDPDGKTRVFATRTVEIGEVLAVEKPICFIVANAELYHCHNCYELCYNPIPCTGCSQTVFCGDSCKEKASFYHDKECSILISLKNLVGKHKACLLAIRLAFLSFNEQQNCNLQQLEDNMGENIPDETFTMALVAAFTFHLVKTRTKIFDGEAPDSEDKFKISLMKQLKICVFYGAGIEELCPNNTDERGLLGQELLKFKSETVGCGIYPLYSLFRHVCCPNVFAHHHGLNRVLRAVRTIKEGDECLVSYGPYYVEHSKEERQSRLSSQYRFECFCRACEENWPQLDLQPYYLKTKEDLLFMSEIRGANIEVAYGGIPVYAKKVKELEHLEPCSDLTLQQKLLSYCYDVLGNKRQIV